MRLRPRPEVDVNNRNVKLILGALAGMVEDDGLTPHEAFELLDEIKNQTWHALMELKRGAK